MKKVISLYDVDGVLCKSLNKWGIRLNYKAGIYNVPSSIDQYDWKTVQDSAPFLNEEESFNLVTEGIAWILTDSEKEANLLFDQIYGDESIVDDSKIPIRATLFNNYGECVDENS